MMEKCIHLYDIILKEEMDFNAREVESEGSKYNCIRIFLFK